MGSPTLAMHSLVACHEVVQRDMDVTGLGFAHGETPFEDLPARLAHARELPWLPAAVCGTGDRFETGRPQVACDVVDMEAYALAAASAISCRSASPPPGAAPRT